MRRTVLCAVATLLILPAAEALRLEQNSNGSSDAEVGDLAQSSAGSEADSQFMGAAMRLAGPLMKAAAPMLGGMMGGMGGGMGGGDFDY